MGDYNTPCIFCIASVDAGSDGVGSERIVHEYEFWWLVLQLEEKRLKTKQSAGMLIAKRHIREVSLATPAEAAELVYIVKDAAQRLCDKTATIYTGQETVGYNQGVEAGQAIIHAHVHILPVSESDPPELKERGGIGGAFEALRRSKLGSDR